MIIKIPAGFALMTSYIAEKVSFFLGRKPVLTFGRAESMSPSRIFSIEKARRELGYAPKGSLKEEIRKMVEDYGKKEKK